MSAWKAFYEGREGHGYLEYVKKRYAPFINAIESRIDYGETILELGAGTGTITKALCDMLETARSKVRLCASDVDDEMVQITRQRLAQDDVAVYVENALDERFVTQADVVHSHGMLEHFNDDQIRQIIDNYRNARAQIHYVPGLYDAPTFGDERLMPVQAWWDICKPDQIITFNGGLDYALIFERD